MKKRVPFFIHVNFVRNELQICNLCPEIFKIEFILEYSILDYSVDAKQVYSLIGMQIFQCVQSLLSVGGNNPRVLRFGHVNGAKSECIKNHDNYKPLLLIATNSIYNLELK